MPFTDCIKSVLETSDVVDVLSESHYTYDGDEGLIYDEYPLDGFNWITGASKICIVIGNVVFKTSFSGYAYDYDYEASDFYDEPRFEDWDINYCEMEYKIYQLAKENGLEDFFAETVRLNSRVYAQPKCDYIFEDYFNSIYIKNINKDNTDTDIFIEILDELGLYSLRVELTLKVMRYLVVEYSIDKLLKLQSFLSNYDINDLHLSNLGFFNDKLKFFDFCGYNSTTSKKLEEV